MIKLLLLPARSGELELLALAWSSSSRILLPLRMVRTVATPKPEAKAIAESVIRYVLRDGSMTEEVEACSEGAAMALRGGVQLAGGKEEK